MKSAKWAFAWVCLLVLSTGFTARAQSQCNSSQDHAVQCFVASAVRTGLSSPRYGMSMSQFEAYGVSVSKILQTDATYLVLVGTSSAIADAMPPTNANGTANTAAQQAAINQIVVALLANSLVTLPSETSQQQLQYFSMDVVSAMNTSGGYLQLMTPGVGLRVIDSYVVTGTSSGSINWTTVDTSLSTAISNMVNAGLIKIPSGVSSSQVNSFVDSVAQAIWTYKQATGRTHL
jgi:hypothetical protein